MILRPRSLVARVALASALACLLSGALVALVTLALTDRLMRAEEDAHLRDAAGTFAVELSERADDPRKVTADEQHELVHTGIRVALFSGATLVAGDARLHVLPAGSCSNLAQWRACAASTGSYLAVAARDRTPLAEHLGAAIHSAYVAVVVTGLLGALLALLLARALLAPLWRLRDAVNRVPDDAPERADLGPVEGVSEVDALRRSLEQAFLRLGLALAQSRRFASDAAHQLRTPLTAILGELDLAEERSSPENREEIARARRVAQRLSALVDRLLILARSSASLGPTRELDLLDVVEDALEALPMPLRGRVVPPDNSVCVSADSTLLVTMLANALDNALKFSSGPVRVELAQHGELAILAVEDEGPGIPESERERVFAPFYRVSTSTAVPGHGLGLALIAHVTALHGGQARFVASRRGARLEMVIPAASNAP